jgi:hypothetical protein
MTDASLYIGFSNMDSEGDFPNSHKKFTSTAPMKRKKRMKKEAIGVMMR